MTGAPQVVAFGECMIELSGIDAETATIGYAGDTFNTAVYLARLGIDVSYATALGDDPFSGEIRALCRREHIREDLILTAAGKLPGLYAIRTDDEGERTFHYWRGQSAAKDFFKLERAEAALSKMSETHALYLSGITLSIFAPEERLRINRLCADVKNNGGCVFFDPNYRPKGWKSADEARNAFETLAPFVTAALPTFSDEAALFGDADINACANRWRGYGVEDIVVKSGADGCLIISAEDAPKFVPVPSKQNPVDTTAAGDSFNAGYIAAHLFGKSSDAAAVDGHRLAGAVIQHHGAIIPASATPGLTR